MAADGKAIFHERYLHDWLVSPTAESPLLVSSADTVLIEETVTRLKALAVCTEGSGCQRCTECKLAQSGAHPDCLDLSPQKLTWAIADVRGLRQHLSHSPRGQRRLVILRAVELLSAPAGNALLKLLEEPSAKTKFLLLTQWPSRLLPTITSRVAKLRLSGTPLAVAAPAMPAAHWQRRVGKKDKLAAEELQAIVEQLSGLLRIAGPTPALRRAFMRVRDYYRITSVRGNEKLASDVLLLSMPAPHGMPYSNAPAMHKGAQS